MLLLCGLAVAQCSYHREKNGPPGASANGSSLNSGETPTYTLLQSKILTPRCVRCHGKVEPESGVDLSSYESVLAGSVVAGKPNESPLYQQVQSDDMPKGKNKLSAAEKEYIRRWIELGALKN